MSKASKTTSSRGNRYRLNGKFADAGMVRQEVSCARGQASAAGRKNAAAINAATIRSRRSNARNARRAQQEQDAQIRAMGRSLRNVPHVEVERPGRQRKRPRFDSHDRVDVPRGSDFNAWARPACDASGMCSLVLKIWAGTATAKAPLPPDAMASKALYVLDPAALAGSEMEATFTNVAAETANQLVPATEAARDEIVAFARALSGLEVDVARKCGHYQLYKHIAVGIPAGLGRDERTTFARGVLEPLIAADLPVIAAIQRPSKARGRQDDRNFHLQILVSKRPFERIGPRRWVFAQLKNNHILSRKGIPLWREHIVKCANEGLARAGLDERFTTERRAVREAKATSTPPPTSVRGFAQLSEWLQQLLEFAERLDTAKAKRASAMLEKARVAAAGSEPGVLVNADSMRSPNKGGTAPKLHQAAVPDRPHRSEAAPRTVVRNDGPGSNGRPMPTSDSPAGSAASANDRSNTQGATQANSRSPSWLSRMLDRPGRGR